MVRWRMAPFSFFFPHRTVPTSRLCVASLHWGGAGARLRVRRLGRPGSHGDEGARRRRGPMEGRKEGRKEADVEVFWDVLGILKRCSGAMFVQID